MDAHFIFLSRFFIFSASFSESIKFVMNHELVKRKEGSACVKMKRVFDGQTKPKQKPKWGRYSWTVPLLFRFLWCKTRKMKSVASFIPIDHGSFYAASETVNYPDISKPTLNQFGKLCSNDELTSIHQSYRMAHPGFLIQFTNLLSWK